MDARLETSNRAAARIVGAVEEGIRDFILSARDGSISAGVRLTIFGGSAASYEINGVVARIDWSEKTVEVGSNRVSLSRTEMRLLGALLEHDGKCASRSALIKSVWGTGQGTRPDRENALAVYVCTLRKRLATIGLGSALRTVRRSGYQLVMSRSAAE